jgi:hypothetical protein
LKHRRKIYGIVGLGKEKKGDADAREPLMWIEDADEPALMRSAAQVFIRRAKAATNPRTRQTLLAQAELHRELAADVDRNQVRGAAAIDAPPAKEPRQRARPVERLRSSSAVVLGTPRRPASPLAGGLRVVSGPPQGGTRARSLNGFGPAPHIGSEIAAGDPNVLPEIAAARAKA